MTGGGSGIGRCTAHEIAALGAHVVITGRKPEKLATVKAEIEAAGGSCETHAFDIREEAQVKEAIAAIVAKNGRIHGLFNNAGGQFPSPAAAMSAKGFDVVVRNNLTGGFIVSREVFTQSMEKHGGSIVNMAADMRNGFPNMAHTGAARAGMVNLTMTLAYEWAYAGVRVNAVSPGWIASSGMDTYQGEFKEQHPQAQGLLPAGAARHRERGLGRGVLPAERCRGLHHRHRDPHRRRRAARQPLDGAARRRTSREPFNGFHLAVTPKVLGG